MNSEGFRKAAKKLDKRTSSDRFSDLTTRQLPCRRFWHCTEVDAAVSACQSATALLDDAARRATAEADSASARVRSLSAWRASTGSGSSSDAAWAVGSAPRPMTLATTSADEAIRAAIRAEDGRRMAFLLRSSGMPAATLLSLGAPLLHAAVRSGDADSVRVLLRLGVPAESPDAAERSPLEVAVRGGWRGVVDALLEAGADATGRASVASFSRRTPLHHAVLAGDARCVSVLLRRAAAADSVLEALTACDRNGHSAAYLAAVAGRPSCLQTLLHAASKAVEARTSRHGLPTVPSPSPSPSNRRPPTVSASRTGASSGTDARPCPNDVWTAVWAVHGLLRRGGTAGLHWTCLHAAAQAGSHECVAALLACGGACAVDDRVGAAATTALHEAASRGYARCVRRLLRGGADPAAASAYSETPLHLAARGGRARVLAMMLKRTPAWALCARLPNVAAPALGASPPADLPATIPSGAGAAPDGSATGAESGTPSPALALSIDAPAPAPAPAPAASPEAAPAPPADSLLRPDLWVPLLHEAVEANSPDCCAVLGRAGADPDAKDCAGWSALALALFSGRRRVAAALREATRLRGLHPELAGAIACACGRDEASAATAPGRAASERPSGALAEASAAGRAAAAQGVNACDADVAKAPRTASEAAAAPSSSPSPSPPPPAPPAPASAGPGPGPGLGPQSQSAARAPKSVRSVGGYDDEEDEPIRFSRSGVTASRRAASGHAGASRASPPPASSASGDADPSSGDEPNAAAQAATHAATAGSEGGASDASAAAERVEEGHPVMQSDEWELHVMLGGAGDGPKGTQRPRPAVSLQPPPGQRLPSRRMRLELAPWSVGLERAAQHRAAVAAAAGGLSFASAQAAPADVDLDPEALETAAGETVTVTLPLRRRHGPRLLRAAGLRASAAADSDDDEALAAEASASSAAAELATHPIDAPSDTGNSDLSEDEAGLDIDDDGKAHGRAEGADHAETLPSPVLSPLAGARRGRSESSSGGAAARTRRRGSGWDAALKAADEPWTPPPLALQSDSPGAGTRAAGAPGFPSPDGGRAEGAGAGAGERSPARFTARRAAGARAARGHHRTASDAAAAEEAADGAPATWETALPADDPELNTSHTFSSRGRGPFGLGLAVSVSSGVGVVVGRAVFPPALLLGTGGAAPRVPDDVIEGMRPVDVGRAIALLCDGLPPPPADRPGAQGIREAHAALAQHCWDSSCGLRLEGEASAPLLAAGGAVMGTVTVRFVLARPYTPPLGAVPSAMTGNAVRAYWRQTRVVGHRGAGADNAAEVLGPAGTRRWRTHVMENTVLSFVTAASLGAEYVEFDVQLSSDGVPVVYHDFGVRLPGGIRVPVSHMTADQLNRVAPLTDHDFLARPRHRSRLSNGSSAGAGAVTGAASPAATPAMVGRPSSPLTAASDASSTGAPAPAPRPALVGASSSPDLQAADRTAPPAPHASGHTSERTLKAMGLDPVRHRNRSSLYYGLRDKLTSLAETFQRVPVSCGFNIEMKYPSPAEVAEGRLIVPDRNTYVDRVLDCTFANAGSRGVIFSSFDPDVCLLLHRKQGTYPVLLLTDAGTQVDADPRRNSLREAIRFARSVGLFGIVSHSKPLLEAPVLMDAVRGAGLVLATFGKRNNEIECVKLQQEHGVAAIIVDHVAHISRGLRAGNGAGGH